MIKVQVRRGETLFVVAWCNLHDTMLLGSPDITEDREVVFGQHALCPNKLQRSCQDRWELRITVRSNGE